MIIPSNNITLFKTKEEALFFFKLKLYEELNYATLTGKDINDKNAYLEKYEKHLINAFINMKTRKVTYIII